MMNMWLLFCLALPCATLQVDELDKSEDGANPLAKIVGMMTDMRTELEKEAKDEKEIFEEAMCICKKGEKELQGVVDFSTAEIERLTSKVEHGTASKAKLAAELKDHATDKEETTKALQEATVIREKENAKFKADDADMKTNLAGLDQAIPMIENQGAGGASFIQGGDESGRGAKLLKIIEDYGGHYLSIDKKATATSFLESTISGTAPELSAGVAELLGILKSMKDEMQADHDEMSKDEHTAAVNYQDMKKTKGAHLKLLAETMLDKQKREGETTLSLAEDKDSLDDTSEELANAQKYLAQLQKACETKASQRDMRAKMRADEIMALSEAIDILSSDDATDAIKKASGNEPTLLATNHPKPHKSYLALVQNAATLKDKTAAPAKRHILKLLSVKSATHEKARDLFRDTRPAGVDESAGAATKVVNFMIDNMVENLHQDDVDDEHKKDWCFNETDVMTRVQEEKTLLEDQLNTSIAAMTEDLTGLQAEIKELEDTIFQQDQTVLKATKQRKEEHEDFVATFAAMDTSLRLLDRAATKLNRIYNPEMQKAKEDAVKKAAAEAAGLGLLQKSSLRKAAVQSHSGKADSKVDPIVLPDTPVEYEKKESGGVIGLMDKLKQEIKADQKESEVDEKYASRDYVALMKDQKVMRASNVESLHTKQAQAADLEDRIHKDSELQEFTIQELAALKVYLRQLDIECTFIMKNYEARHGARVGEEMGLEGAETIVTHEDPPTHKGTVATYEAEHSHKQVDEHFPADTLEDALGKPAGK
jgi:hypothetical protein